MTKLHHSLLASCALMAFASASPAFAQDAPTAPQTDPATEAAATADPGDDRGGEEAAIVVTAQKRAEDQQDVPISITVVSGEQLVESGAVQLNEIAGYVPGLHVNTLGAPGQSLISLRGVPPLGGNSSVGIYVDDAPVGSSTAYTESGLFSVDLLPYDLARIEVLRGPQGTLYGASTLGGLLKYVTVAPDLDEFRARAGVEGFSVRHAGNLGYAFQGFVNAPLVMDQLAVTASFAHRKTPGWIDNIQTGEKDQNEIEQTGFRGSLLWQPTDKLRVRLSALRQTIKSDSGATFVEDLDQDPIGNGRSNFNYFPEKFSSKFLNLAGTIEYDFGFAALSSTTTYSDVNRVEVSDASRIFGPYLGGILNPFKNRITLQKVTEEVRLTSPSGGRFEWLLGYFYTDEDAGNRQFLGALLPDYTPVPGLDPLAIIGLPSTYKEHAVFGNATFRFTEQFWLSGGLRWSHNDQTFRQITAGPLLGPGDTPGKSDESIVTYSVSPQFHLDNNTMFYGRVATGYRPGGPNVIFPGIPPSFDPDTITNYELGVKTRLANRTVTLDVALFQMDWKDIQVTKSFPGGSGLANGGTARSKGLEAAVLWQPIRALTFGANAAFTDAELTEDAPEIGGLDGESLAYVPKFSGSLTADYNFRVGNLPAEIGGGIRHTGKRYNDVGPAFPTGTRLTVGAYTAVDLYGSVTFLERFKVRAYVRNLFDEGGPLARSVISDAAQLPSFISVVPLQPRTVGLALDAEF